MGAGEDLAGGGVDQVLGLTGGAGGEVAVDEIFEGLEGHVSMLLEDIGGGGIS